MGFSLPEPLPFGENGGGADKGPARRAHKPKARSLGNRLLCLKCAEGLALKD